MSTVISHCNTLVIISHAQAAKLSPCHSLKEKRPKRFKGAVIYLKINQLTLCTELLVMTSLERI